MQWPRFAIHFRFSILPCSAAVRAQHIRRLPKGRPSVPNLRSKVSKMHSLKALPRFHAKDSRNLVCNLAFPLSFFLSPGAAQTAAPTPKLRKIRFWVIFFRILALPCCIINFASKKWQKNVKILDFGLPKHSQNDSKTPSKSRSTNICISLSICVRFLLLFLSSISWTYAFYHGKTTIFKVFVNFLFLLFAHISRLENLTKTFPNRRPNRLKIDAKNVLFFYIDFLGSWPRFGRLQVGATLA